MTLRIRNIFIYPVICCFVCCTKFVTVSPPKSQIVSSVVFSDDATATAAITGIYSRMISDQGFASGSVNSVTYNSSLSSDELINYSPSAESIQFYTNSLTPSNGINGSLIWALSYQYIYSANAILEGLSASTAVSQPVKQQILGEAEFVRAFCYFYLVNLYGDVPLIVSTDYQVNEAAVRMPASSIYKQIITDLLDAKKALAIDYSFSNGERVRPNLWIATALLARTYLYTGDWVDAETESSSIIGNNTFFNLPGDLDSVFLANSSEAIWQLPPVQPGVNTNEAQSFIFTDKPENGALSDQLISSFESGDNRLTDWIGSSAAGGQIYYYPYKYKVISSTEVTEYSMVLRLGEQYLVRSEARAQQGNLSGAVTDLNIIRVRAGLPATSATTLTDLLKAIQHERQVELFTEWGHRWLDLKRNNQAGTVLAPLKPQWKPTAVFYPLPVTDLNSDPNLVQNPGYN